MLPSDMPSPQPTISILFIDNYDSFTYNLTQFFKGLHAKVHIYQNDRITLDEAIQLNPSHIVLGPGPGNPYQAGCTLDIIDYFHDKTPILGVCLGHQAIGVYFGATLDSARFIQHGKKDICLHSAKGLFCSLPSPLRIGRYHSLAIHSIPDILRIDAKSPDGTIMAITHTEFPVYGIQFHPESILTPQGYLLLEQFLRQ